MKKLRNYFLTVVAVLAAFTVLFSGPMTTFAAQVNISFSDPSVSEGSEVTVTMKVQSTDQTGIGRADIMLSYDASMLEFIGGTSASGDAGAIRISEATASNDAVALEFQLTFKTIKAGTAKIEVTTQEVYDIQNQIMDLGSQGSSAVTIGAGAGLSNQALLKEMIISPGELSPQFSPEVTEYQVSIGSDVEKLAISAIPQEEGKASVSISGNEQLVEGENRIICKVTAEDGVTEKEYAILAMKGGQNEQSDAVSGILEVSLKDGRYYIAPTWNALLLPEGFEADSYDYMGQSISVGRGLEKNLVLFYLINSSDQGGFYIFNEAQKTFAPYVELETSRKAIVVISPDSQVKLPQGFAESDIKIEDQIVQGWVWESETNHEYCVFYAMNWNGEKGFYRYDTKEKTIQRYFQDPALSMNTAETNELIESANEQMYHQYQQRLMIISGLIFAAAAISIFIAAMWFRKSKRRLEAEIAAYSYEVRRIGRDDSQAESEEDEEADLGTPKWKQPENEAEEEQIPDEEETDFEYVDLDD